MRVRLLATAAAFVVSTTGLMAIPVPVQASAAAATTLYVDVNSSACTDTGTGAQDAPFCTIQAAANATAAGDTVLISGDASGYASYNENVLINRSGTQSAPITFKAAQDAFWLTGTAAGLRFDNAHFVDVVGADVQGQVSFNSSSDITIDRSSFDTFNGTAPVVTIGGGAQNVTIERSRVTLESFHIGGNALGTAVEVNGSAAGTVLTSDIVSGDVAVSGASATDVVGDTITTGCDSGISVTGAEQTVIENDIVIPYCSSAGPAVLSADAPSGSSTTAEYNILATSGTYQKAYSWAGTAYGDADAFHAATGQGTADVIVPSFTLSSDAIDPTNPAIDSADAGAPGELSTDVSGNQRADDPAVTDKGTGSVGYYDRGAVEYAEFTDSAFTTYADSPQRVTTALDLTGFAWGSPLTYTVSWGDGTNEYSSDESDFQFNEPSIVNSHVYTKRGTYVITATLKDAAQTITKTATFAATGSTYTAVTPTRVLDTRAGLGAVKAKVGPKHSLPVNVVSGVPGAPAAGTISAVVMNVTETNPTATGYITAYADGVSVPTSSNLDFVPGRTTANLVTVKVKNGVVDLYNGSGGTVDLIADVAGYYVNADGGGFTPMTPTRLLDTRYGTGAPKAPVGATGTVALKIEGVGSIPATGVSAVALNVTETAPQGDGYITVYPSDGSVPKVSNVDYPRGLTVANMVVVKVGADGKIDLKNTSSGTVQLIADVAGYYTASGGHPFVATDPRRLLDTRKATGQESAGPIPVAPGRSAVWFLDDQLQDEVAIVANVTVTDTRGGGYITAYPSDTARPTASNIDFTAGVSVPNLVMVRTTTQYSSGGRVNLYNASAANVDLIADLFGYFT